MSFQVGANRFISALKGQRDSLSQRHIVRKITAFHFKCKLNSIDTELFGNENVPFPVYSTGSSFMSLLEHYIFARDNYDHKGNCVVKTIESAIRQEDDLFTHVACQIWADS